MGFIEELKQVIWFDLKNRDRPFYEYDAILLSEWYYQKIVEDAAVTYSMYLRANQNEAKAVPIDESIFGLKIYVNKDVPEWYYRIGYKWQFDRIQSRAKNKPQNERKLLE